MPIRTLHALLAATFLWPAVPLFAQSDPFLEKPYLQIGDAPTSAETMVLLWHTEADSSGWSVEIRTTRDGEWRQARAPTAQKVEASGIPPHLVYRAKLSGLVPGEPFRYRLLLNGRQVFETEGHARKTAAQSQRFVLFGDCAQGTVCQRMVAHQAARAKPDYLLITGDIVYGAGRISEYRSRFFPVYNADEASPFTGAPLLRSIPFVAAPGNHDIALKNFAAFPDALAYFLYWDQPLNGPAATEPKTRHELGGNADGEAAFRAAAAPRYPGMANFSFDYGNVHWTVLDSNSYMDWTNPALKKWLTSDLAAAHSATWRFVAFHHPGFNSSKSHFSDQWMRLLAPIFEAGKVDIVFSGHVHNYQRTYPLAFAPKAQPDGLMTGPKGEVAGEWTLDREFKDGVKSPQGVIYIVSGAGGAGLYNPEQQADQSAWQPFTQKYIADQHSLTVVEIDGGKLRMRQVSEHGFELDSFRLTK